MRLMKKSRALAVVLCAVLFLTCFSACERSKTNDGSNVSGDTSHEGKYQVLVNLTKFNKDGASTEVFSYGLDNGNIVWGYNNSLKSEKFTNGKNTETIEYNTDGSIKLHNKTEYDANGKMTKNTNYKPDGTVGSMVELKYDVCGHNTEVIDYYGGGKVDSRTEYKYNANGKETETIYYNSNGTVEERHERIYDDKGNVTQYINYHSDGTSQVEQECKYDKKGNITESLLYSIDGALFNHTKYDTYGNIIESTIYNTDGTAKEVYKYEYNAKGNKIKYEVFTGGVISIWLEWKYDELGHMTEYMHYNNDSTLASRTEYEKQRIRKNDRISLL